MNKEEYRELMKEMYSEIPLTDTVFTIKKKFGDLASKTYNLKCLVRTRTATLDVSPIDPYRNINVLINRDQYEALEPIGTLDISGDIFMEVLKSVNDFEIKISVDAELYSLLTPDFASYTDGGFQSQIKLELLNTNTR